jgi:hypothetical protein
MGRETARDPGPHGISAQDVSVPGGYSHLPDDPRRGRFGVREKATAVTVQSI